MSYNFKSEEEVKEFIKNLGIEYRFGCFNEKKSEVCHLLGDYLEAIDKNYEKACKVYKNNCDEYKFGKSCKKYASYALLGKGLKTPNVPEAYNYFDKGCKLDNPESCLHQGLMIMSQSKESGVKRDVIKAMSLLDRACNSNNANACYFLSGMHIAGVKKNEESKDTSPDNYQVPKNMTKAFHYTTKGCELNNMYCCMNLSQMYAKGDGVAKDLKLAEQFKRKALEIKEEMEETNKTLTFQQGLS